MGRGFMAFAATHRSGRENPRPRQKLWRQPQHDFEATSMTASATSEYTVEQLDGLKLEGIFMPYARKQRDKMYSTDKAARFVHYTSAENALKILTTKGLWMRSTVCMSDYREVQHGHDILLSYFSDEARRTKFCSALDASVQGAALPCLMDGGSPPSGFIPISRLFLNMTIAKIITAAFRCGEDSAITSHGLASFFSRQRYQAERMR
jgi:hypothetical protein